MGLYRLQRGTTIISLLVGMVVSMLAILASLSMFRDLVATSTEAKADARQEGDLSLAVLRLETELQAAGFNMSRIPGAGRNWDFFPIAPTASRSDVAWRFNDGSQFICRRATSINDNGHYTLDIFNAIAANCNATWRFEINNNVATDANWVFVERLVDLRLQNLSSLAAAFTQPLITFKSLATDDRACMPFGAMAPVPTGGTAPSHPLLIIGVFDVATVYGTAAGAAIVPTRPHTLCLANIF